MMAIKVNARETELKIGKKPGYYYVMTPDLYLALNQKKVVKENALRSGVSQSVMQVCYFECGSFDGSKNKASVTPFNM